MTVEMTDLEFEAQCLRAKTAAMRNVLDALMDWADAQSAKSAEPDGIVVWPMSKKARDKFLRIKKKISAKALKTDIEDQQ